MEVEPITKKKRKHYTYIYAYDSTLKTPKCGLRELSYGALSLFVTLPN